RNTCVQAMRRSGTACAIGVAKELESTRSLSVCPWCVCDGTTAWFQRGEVIDMFLARDWFTVSLVGDLPRSRPDRAIACGIVPERTDGIEPRLDFVLSRQLRRLERHPVGDRQDASAATPTEIAADDIWQRSPLADERGDRIDHRFSRDPAEGFF